MSKFRHIGIKVKNIEISKKFYEDVLELKCIDTYENERLKLALMEGEDYTIELLQYLNDKENRFDGIIDHIAFTVKDIKGKIKDLKRKKVEILFEEERRFRDSYIFFFRGPDGERIEIVEDITSK